MFPWTEDRITMAAFDTQEERGNTVAERFSGRLMMNVPGLRGPHLTELIRRVNEDDELYALWLAANVNAVERLGMTDHGPTHVKIVMNIADKLLRLLLKQGVRASVTSEYGMTNEEAEVVVVLAALFHDVGMSIHRVDHEAFSLFVAQDKLRRLLDGVYDTASATILRSEVLHAIIGHRTSGRPLTLEAGIVRVADALDMAAGRSRISVASGSTSIHSLSAAAIESVHLDSGDVKPVRVRIRMSNSAGVFQLDHLFREKLAGSGLERYVELEANIEGDAEKSLFTTYHL